MIVAVTLSHSCQHRNFHRVLHNTLVNTKHPNFALENNKISVFYPKYVSDPLYVGQLASDLSREQLVQHWISCRSTCLVHWSLAYLLFTSCSILADFGIWMIYDQCFGWLDATISADKITRILILSLCNSFISTIIPCDTAPYSAWLRSLCDTTIISGGFQTESSKLHQNQSRFGRVNSKHVFLRLDVN